MKKKKLIYSLIGLVVLLAIAIGGFFFKQQKDINEVQDVKPVKVVSTNTPTFFIHGYGSSYHAEEKMVAAFRRAGVTKNVMRVNVTANGRVIMHGKLSRKGKNPIVMINMDDNRLSKYRNNYVQGYERAGSRYVRNALQAVVKKYGFRQVNIVAHSMGNLETAYFFKKYYKTIPVSHFISMAGHYDGIVGINDQPNRLKLNVKTGKPNRMQPEFRGLLSLRKTFPKRTRVLNIFGNLEDGTNSDGDVSVNSAKSLKYLVGSRAKSYRELMIRGKAAQHSRLHNNRQVNQAIMNFLWRK